MENIIFFVGFVYFLAHLLGALFNRTKIPDVLFLMIAGVLIGPLMGWVNPSDFGKVGHVMTTMALILILFESGLTLDLLAIASNWRTTLIVTLTIYFVSGIAIALIGWFFFSLPPWSAASMGAILAGVSAVVVIPLVKSLRMKEPASGMLIMESAITDVLCIVLTLAMVNASQGGDRGLHAGHLIGGILASFFFAALMGILGGIGWLFLIKRIRRFPDTIFTTLAALFILYGLTEFLGFSGGIAALTFGLALAIRRVLTPTRLSLPGLRFLKNITISELNKIEHGFFREVIFVLKIFFFVYLGTSIPLKTPATWIFGAIFVLVLLAVRAGFLKWLLPKQVTGKEAGLMAIMSPKGVAAAALAAIPLEAGMEGGALIQSLVYTVIFLSILATALGVPLIDKTFIGRWAQWWFPQKITSKSRSSPP